MHPTTTPGEKDWKKVKPKGSSKNNLITEVKYDTNTNNNSKEKGDNKKRNKTQEKASNVQYNCSPHTDPAQPAQRLVPSG